MGIRETAVRKGQDVKELVERSFFVNLSSQSVRFSGQLLEIDAEGFPVIAQTARAPRVFGLDGTDIAFILWWISIPAGRFEEWAS